MESFNLPVKSVPIKGWKDVLIIENKEPLVDLKNLICEKLCIQPIYFEWKIQGAIDSRYARHSVSQKLRLAAMQLPSDYQLVVFDAWRPVAVQQALYDGYFRDLRASRPEYDEDYLHILTQEFVSKPSIDSNRPSPHFTGGSVDVGLLYNGKAVDMGTEFDSFSEVAHADFFERMSGLTEQQINQRNHRRLLHHCMTQQGFTSHPNEWWHYDYGNQIWGFINQKNAIYSAVSV